MTIFCGDKNLKNEDSAGVLDGWFLFGLKSGKKNNGLKSEKKQKFNEYHIVTIFSD